MESQRPASEESPLHSLLHAFAQFNRLSERLTDSVERINQSVERINPAVEAESANLTAGLFDSIPGGIVVLDPQGRISEANADARELLGQSIHREYWRDVVQRVFLPELDQGELKTGEGRQFSIATRPLGFAPGQVLLLTETTQTRDLQRTAQQNLHLVTMGKMMASLAHQIRTPLASSLLYLSQCVETTLNPKTLQGFCQKALARNRHIEKLINDMLVFAHGGQFVTTRFSLEALLANLEELLQPQLQQRNAQFRIENATREIELQGNEDALLGALANLCINALQASEQAPRIEVAVSTTRQGLLSISLKDNGCGMDRNTRAHIFDPFYSTKTDGTGLGLAVVKAVIESHQGRIAVFSRPGRGSRFRLFLPCRQLMRTQISDASKTLIPNGA